MACRNIVWMSKALTIILEPFGNIHSLNIGRLFEGSCVQNKFMSHIPCWRTWRQLSLCCFTQVTTGQFSAWCRPAGTKSLRELGKVTVGNKEFIYSLTRMSHFSSPHTSEPGNGRREMGITRTLKRSYLEFLFWRLKISLKRLNTILILFIQFFFSRAKDSWIWQLYCQGEITSSVSTSVHMWSQDTCIVPCDSSKEWLRFWFQAADQELDISPANQMRWYPPVILALSRGTFEAVDQDFTLKHNPKRNRNKRKKERGWGTPSINKNQRDWNLWGSVRFNLVYKQPALLGPSGATGDPTTKNKLVMGLGRWLSHQEYFQFFQSLVCSTHVRQLTALCNSCSRQSIAAICKPHPDIHIST